MMKINCLISIASIFCLVQCAKEEPQIGPNPFNDNYQDSSDNLDTLGLDPANIFSIHKNIFLKTCANSGCHDGNFEPDFRTVESSYYGLVNIPVVKSKIGGGFDKRVVPGDAANSMLLYRMTEDLNGNSGIMPLGLEEDSDYPINKDKYLQDIKKWIDDGAADMYGNLPRNTNYPPVIKGIEVHQNGSSVRRVGVYEPVGISTQNGNIDVYLSLYDKEGKLDEINDLRVGLSIRPDSFDQATAIALQSIPPTLSLGLFNEKVTYNYKFSINTVGYKPLDVVWFRFFLTDSGEAIEVPSETSMFFLKKYAAIKFIN